jgi:hypothetical protein
LYNNKRAMHTRKPSKAKTQNMTRADNIAQVDALAAAKLVGSKPIGLEAAGGSAMQHFAHFGWFRITSYEHLHGYTLFIALCTRVHA